jgi:type II secretory pathway pseudopilin PulG
MRNIVPARNTNEDGYLLVWVMFLLVLFTIALSLAVPREIKEIQRDRELETMNRGKQYIRAVQLYYRKFHRFPPNANALVNTNEIRFLRKKYTDPITAKDDWKPIRFGEAKTQASGFFGQPIAGAGSAGATVLAGTGPSGSDGLGSGSSLGSSFGGSTGSSIGGSTGSSFGGSTIGSSPLGGATTGIAGSTSSTGSIGTAGSSGSSSAFGSSNQTFGGAGIIGFSPASTKASIFIYRKKQHYNEWEFVYDPLTDTRTQSGNTGTIGQPAGSTSTPVGGSNNNGIGFGPGSSGSGSSSAPPSGNGNAPPSGAGPTPPSPPETPAPPLASPQ